MLKTIVLSVVLFSVALSGCLDPGQGGETMPEDVQILQISPSELKVSEGKSTAISVLVANNGSGPLEQIHISSLSGFSVSSNDGRNIAVKKSGETLPNATLTALVTAPSYKDAPTESTLMLSYKSNGEKTKNVEVPVKILPDAELQFVGFAASKDTVATEHLEKITTKKAGTIFVTFSVKNNGDSTIDVNTLKVLVDVKEDSMGQDNQRIVSDAMARKGTSHTLSCPITIPETAPNGETDVTVTLVTSDGGEVLDSEQITLVVSL